MGVKLTSAVGAQLIHPLLADPKDCRDFLPRVPFVVHRGSDQAGQLGIEAGDRFGPLGAVGGDAFEGCHGAESSNTLRSRGQT